jgi:hypothetical protein
MTKIDSFTPTSYVVRRVILTFGGLALAVAGICLLFLGMRAVMDVGGFCAEGGPFEIRQRCPQGIPGIRVCGSGNTVSVPRVQCPDGVAGVMLGGIFGGLIGLAVYAINTFSFNFTLLAWPALFLSLGFNFFDYGISPPPEFGSGVEAGWIVCGVVFALMGGVPLLLWIAAVMGKRESRITKIDPQQSLRDRLRMSTGGPTAEDPQTREKKLRTLSIAVHVMGVVLGIWGGMELYEWITGSQVRFGFR